MKQLFRDILIIVGLVAIAYVAWPTISAALGLTGQTTAVRIEDRQPAQIIEIQVQAPAGVGDAYQVQPAPPAQPTPTLAPTAPTADFIGPNALSHLDGLIGQAAETLAKCRAVQFADPYQNYRCERPQAALERLIAQRAQLTQ